MRFFTSPADVTAPGILYCRRKAKESDIAVYRKQVVDIYRRRAWVAIRRVASAFGFRGKLDVSVVDFRREFERMHERKPDEDEEKIINEEYQEILAEIRSEHEDWRQRHEREERERTAGITRMIMPDRTAQLRSEEFIKKEEQTLHDAAREIKLGESNISSLTKEKIRLQSELTMVFTPKHIRAGYGTLIYFAIVGIVLPFTYEYWAIYSLQATDVIAVGLFITGLAAVLIYIFYEATAALK